MRRRFVNLVLLLPPILMASAHAADAYVGPGAGLSAIGSLVSVVAAVLLAIAGFIWYPVKRLLRCVRRAPQAAEPEARAGTPAE